MPGIADLVPAQIQSAGIAGTVDTQPPVNVSSLGHLPEFQDFMNAYKTGVITAEDIKRRQAVGTSGYEAEAAQNVAAKSAAEQANIDINEVRPLQRELTKAQTTGGTTQQTLLNQLNDPDPSVALPAREAYQHRQNQLAAIQVFGTATPKLEVLTGAKPEEFDSWVNRQVNAFEGTPAQRAAYETNLRLKGDKGEEYQVAVKTAKNQTRELKPGTPEYDHELRLRTDQALTHQQLQAIQFQTLAEFGKAKAQAAAKEPEQRAADAEKLAKEYNALPALHDFDKVDASYNKLISATDPNPAIPPTPLRDQAAIFSWMKILDPGSTVREGEYASAKNARGIPDKVRNFYNQALTGQILTPEQRKEMREAAAPVYQGQVQNLAPRIKQYAERERAAGLPPGTVVPLEHRALLEGHAAAQGVPTATPAQAPRPTVEQSNSAPAFSSLAEVPSNVQFFKTTENPPRLLVNPNFRP
jgi:hypothetical protein